MGDYGASSYGASGYGASDYNSEDYRQGIVGGGEMEETPGYDSQFNDGALRASLSTSTRARPAMWPKSASEMGRFVAVSDQMQSPNHDQNDMLLRVTLSASTRARPDMWPKSASEMSQHVHCPAQAMNEDADIEHTRWAARSSGPPPGRNGWVFMPHSKKWVRA